jgi:CPA2 family monovalent cation:H+ antiporter-2
MNMFSLLLDIVVALGAALVLGLALARLGQNAVVGYLLAGVLIGPHGLALLRAVSDVRAMAELGVALLLFTIGLELPWRRLRALGVPGVGAGTMQIVGTGAATAVAVMALGLGPGQATVLGMIIAFSSTAVVFRVLAERAEIDSVAGRVSVAILLIQDVAVIPFIVLVPIIAGATADLGTFGDLGIVVARGALLIAAVWVVARTVMRILFDAAAAARNRELFAILSLAFSLGATWAAHALHLSPVLGAFVAGVFLADTRYTVQVRAELAPLRAGFLALFFVSIGMLADPTWTLTHAPLVAGTILAILVGKTAVTGLVVRAFGYPTQIALIVALTLAHIGELSFVVAEAGRRAGVIDASTFRLVISASVISLILAPYLMGSARRVTERLPLRAAPSRSGRSGAPGDQDRSGHVIVVGAGPTGLQVVQALEDFQTPHLVLELNPRTVQRASQEGIHIEYGDASQEEVLRHAGITGARAMVVTVPDPETAVAVVNSAKHVRPDLLVVARSRYALHSDRLSQNGADVVVNEEELMGEQLAAVSVTVLGLGGAPGPV